MKVRRRHPGYTLTEMLVVVGGISLLVFFGLPAVRMLFQSFESQSGTRTLIESALASARTIAAKEQRYAGVRFQKAYDPRGPLSAPQYMIFIVHDKERTNRDSGFRAVEGVKPIRLPDSVGVMDMLLGLAGDASVVGIRITDTELRDTTSFSILFSPTGKLVIHNVQVWNRGGTDDVFNTQINVAATPPVGMFVQDDTDELSRNSFLIYDRTEFRKMTDADRVSYLTRLFNTQMDYVNAYTGRLISRDRR